MEVIDLRDLETIFAQVEDSRLHRTKLHRLRVSMPSDSRSAGTTTISNAFSMGSMRYDCPLWSAKLDTFQRIVYC